MTPDAEFMLLDLSLFEHKMTEEHLWPMLREMGVPNPEDFYVVFEIKPMKLFPEGRR